MWGRHSAQGHVRQRRDSNRLQGVSWSDTLYVGVSFLGGPVRRLRANFLRRRRSWIAATSSSPDPRA
jgi:hypothetical protein